MSEHTITVEWKRETPDFDYQTYNRDHDWSFDAGITVRASATPAYQGNERCVDPEEAFVASLSSCHMLTFLAIGHGSGLWITQSSCSEPQAAAETVAKSLFLIKSNDGQPVPDDLVAHTLLELERRFGGRVVRDADDPRRLAARRRVVPR